MIPVAPLTIAFAGVSVVAGNVTILDGVTLTLLARSLTVLIGPNGAGKTTFLRTAMGLIRPTGGTLTWQGTRAVPPLSSAMVFQRPVMLRRSAAANLRYALAAAGIPYARRQQRTTELLRMVGLQALAARPARRLSGGEQRRLAIARAMAGEPTLLLLDEPTAGLDPGATRAIEEVIVQAAANGVKVIMSTHDLGQARRLADDIVFLHLGHLIEHSEAPAFFAAPRTPEAARFIAGDLLV